MEMQADLRRNYAIALSDSASRGVTPQIQYLETLLQGTVATINIDAKLLRNMSLGQNYMSYYKSLDLGLRKIAAQMYHAHRGAVDEKVHTGYRLEILNAALSPDGRGLTNYGPITLELQNIAIEDRASVMRENSWDFFERYGLDRRDAREEPGWRSVWADRSKLGVAHLAAAISPATPRVDLPNKIMFAGATRSDDSYMEVHIFGELSWQSLSKVTLEKPLTNSEDQDNWVKASQKLALRPIDIVDRTQP